MDDVDFIIDFKYIMFFISVFYIINRRRTWANIIACILSIVFMIIAFSLVSIETVIVVN